MLERHVDSPRGGMALGGLYRVMDQHRHRHRAHAPWDGRDVGGFLSNAFKVYVAYQSAIGQAVDSYVNHHRGWDGPPPRPKYPQEW